MILPHTHHGVVVLTDTLYVGLMVAVVIALFVLCKPQRGYDPYIHTDWNEYGDGGPIESKQAGE